MSVKYNFKSSVLFTMSVSNQMDFFLWFSVCLHFSTLLHVFAAPLVLFPSPLTYGNSSRSALKSSILSAAKTSTVDKILKSISMGSYSSSVAQLPISVISTTIFPIQLMTFPSTRSHSDFKAKVSSSGHTPSSVSTSLYIPDLFSLPRKLEAFPTKPATPEQEFEFSAIEVSAPGSATSEFLSTGQVISSMQEPVRATTSSVKLASSAATPTLPISISGPPSISHTLSTSILPAAQQGQSAKAHDSNMVITPVDVKLTADSKLDFNTVRNKSSNLHSNVNSRAVTEALTTKYNTLSPKFEFPNIRNLRSSSGKRSNVPLEMSGQISKQNGNETLNGMLLKMADVVLRHKSLLLLFTGAKSFDNYNDQLERVLRNVDTDFSDSTVTETRSEEHLPWLERLSAGASQLKAAMYKDDVEDKNRATRIRKTGSFLSKALNEKRSLYSNIKIGYQYENEATTQLRRQLDFKNTTSSISQAKYSKRGIDFDKYAEKRNENKNSDHTNERYKTDISASRKVPGNNFTLLDDVANDPDEEKLFKHESLRDMISNDYKKLRSNSKESSTFISIDVLNSSSELSGKTDFTLIRDAEDLKPSHSELHHIYRHSALHESQGPDKIYHPHQATLPKLFNPLIGYKVAKNFHNEPILVPPKNISPPLSPENKPRTNALFGSRRRGQSLHSVMSVSASAGKNSHHAPSSEQKGEFGIQFEAPKYHFRYDVDDVLSGNFFSHSENRNGNETSGQYSVLLPDGRKQIVSYVADTRGYKADIRYEDAVKNKDNHYIAAARQIPNQEAEDSLLARGGKNFNGITTANTRIVENVRYGMKPLNFKNIRFNKTDNINVFGNLPLLAKVKVVKSHVKSQKQGLKNGEESTLQIKKLAPPSRQINRLSKVAFTSRNVENSKQRKKLKVDSQESVFSVKDEKSPLIFHPTILALGRNHFWANFLRSKGANRTAVRFRPRKEKLSVENQRSSMTRTAFHSGTDENKRKFSRADFFIPASKRRAFFKRNSDLHYDIPFKSHSLAPSNFKRHSTEAVGLLSEEIDKGHTDLISTPQDQHGAVDETAPLSLFVKLKRTPSA